MVGRTQGGLRLEYIHLSLPKVLVLGAGASGLVAAWCLAKNGVEVDVVEIEPQVGGHASTIRIRDNLYADLAPHAFHIKESEVTSIVEDLMGSALRRIPSYTQMRIRGRNFDYPLNVPNLVSGLNPILSMRVVLDYAKANMIGKIVRMPERSFEDWCTKRFGRTLADLCFLHYTRKVWGRNPSELSSALAQQKLVRLNLKDLFVKLIGFRGQEQPAYFREFYYPEHGIGQLWESLAGDVRRHGGKIHLKSRVDHIEAENGRPVTVHARNDTTVVYRDRWIISTIPITALIDALGHAVPRSVHVAASLLKFRSLVLLFVIVKRDRVLRPQWIYLLDDEFTFNRISDQKAMSEKMLTPGRTVLCLEKNCDFDDDVWNASADEHLGKAIEELEQAKLVSRDEVEDCCIAKIRYAYPVFEIGFQDNLSIVMQYLSNVENLLTAGRPGLYVNNDMHDSMEIGLMAARYVIESLGKEQRLASRGWYQLISSYKKAKGW
jgi:protoporphyrinogen oxidase